MDPENFRIGSNDLVWSAVIHRNAGMITEKWAFYRQRRLKVLSSVNILLGEMGTICL